MWAWQATLTDAFRLLHFLLLFDVFSRFHATRFSPCRAFSAPRFGMFFRFFFVVCTFREKYIKLPGISESFQKDLKKNCKKNRVKLFTLL